MRSRAKQGQSTRFRVIGMRPATPEEQAVFGVRKMPVYSGHWPQPGSKRGDDRRSASANAFLEAAEQTPLTNWQTFQWERACRLVPRRADGRPRKLPDRYPFSKLERRPAV